jgi:CRISPR-associated endonuclease/helicase Cas3
MPEWWLDITVNDQNDLTRRVDEDRKALARHRQTLDGHQQDVAEALAGILGRLTVPVTAEERAALEFAARWHDQGKAVDRWQKAFRGKAYALTERRAEGQPLFVGGPYAKSDVGQANQQILGGYRHEFGTLFDGPVLDALTQLSPDAQALALHLIASHHGHARPVIETAGVDDHPPSRVAAEATAVALRFAHLQERIGPWRLAWLEALVRAADAMASANPNKGVQHG